MSLMAQFEQVLADGLSALDDRINGRIKALEIRMAKLEEAVNSAPGAKTTLGTTARAGTARGTGKANP